MSAPVDRLIARVVGGRHDVRAPQPPVVEPEAAWVEEWTGEVETEVVVAAPVRQPPSLVEPAGPETPAPDALPRDTRTAATGATERAAMRQDVQPLESPDRGRDERRVPGLPVAQTDDSRVDVVAHEAHASGRVARTVPAPVARRQPAPPRRSGVTREEARRAAPPPAPEVEGPAATAEPDRITIDIGRITVAGSPPAPRRMLTLDAYLAARREGTR
jgi:hypothetical protein